VNICVKTYKELKKWKSQYAMFKVRW
jgi:hypothetical protein